MTTTAHTPNTQHQKQGEECCQATHAEIARAAFGLYEERGSRSGNEVKNWLDAEAQVKGIRAESFQGKHQP